MLELVEKEETQIAERRFTAGNSLLFAAMQRRSVLILCLQFLAAPFLISQSSSGSATFPGTSITIPGTESPFTGSQPEEKASPEVLQIGFADAIDRGLHNNLGLLIAGDNTLTARGEKWKELSDLLPNLHGNIEENVQTQSLSALGLNGKVFPGAPRVIGPFNYFDARAYLSQSVFDFKAIEKERAAEEGVRAAQYSYKDARELVVLAVGNAYLLAIAQAARSRTAEAQVKNAEALYGKAADSQKAGLTAGIDTLRSQVELQTRQQQLIVGAQRLR